MTGSCYKPSEGFCERVVIGSQARLRIWCLCAYGFESLRSHKNSSRIGCFFCPAKGQRLRIPSPPDSPYGARGKVSPGPLLSLSSRKTEVAFPPDPHYGGTGAVAHVEAVPSLCGQAPPQTSRPETLWSPLADYASGIVTYQTVWGQSDHSSVFQSP